MVPTPTSSSPAPTPVPADPWESLRRWRGRITSHPLLWSQTISLITEELRLLLAVPVTEDMLDETGRRLCRQSTDIWYSLSDGLSHQSSRDLLALYDDAVIEIFLSSYHQLAEQRDLRRGAARP